METRDGPVQGGGKSGNSEKKRNVIYGRSLRYYPRVRHNREFLLFDV